MKYLIVLALLTACAPARDLGPGKDPIAYTNGFLQKINDWATTRDRGP